MKERVPSRAELYRAIERLVAENGRLRAENERLQAENERAQVEMAALSAQVHELTAARTDPPARPPSWVKPNKPPRSAEKKGRRKRTQQFARCRAVGAVVVEHAVAQCAGCASVLAGGTPKRHREVIEIVLSPAVVTDHVLLERVCPACGLANVPTLGAAEGVVGQHRFGVTLLGLIGTWHEVGRLPVRVIQRLLATLFEVHVSVGAIARTLHTLAERAQAPVAQIQAEIRASAVVHADETGWREDGLNGYVWQMSTPTAVYFERGRRTNEQIDSLLGKDFAGVLVTDFYAAYDHFLGEKQRCWAHLLRDVRDLMAAHPADAPLQRWGRFLGRLFRATRDGPGTTPAQRRQIRQRAEASLLKACQPYMATAAPQRTLCLRIAKHLSELFTFVSNPDVPPTNNLAERTFRPLVIARKIWGGTRSAQGSTDAMRRASLVATWHRRGLNVFSQFRALLLAPSMPRVSEV